MRFIKPLNLGVIVVVLCAGCAGITGHAGARDLGTAAPETVGMSAERLARWGGVLQNTVDDGELAGVVSMIARHGKVVYFDAIGTLDRETGAPLQKDSIFRIYSMSKPITTVAAMLLYEEGRFQLTDPVADYLPEFKNILVLDEGQLVKQKRPFTIQMLMTHTAGFTYGVFGNTTVDQQYRQAGIFSKENLAEMVTGLGNIPLQYQPGTRWHYSVSTDVLGRLVEVVSGQRLDVFLKARLFDPLGMVDTFFEVPANKLDRFGTNHRYNPDTAQLEVIDRPTDSRFAKDVSFFSGGGGLLSTAADYMRFCQMLLNGGELNGVRILGRKTVDYMTQNHLNGIFPDRGGESAQNRPGSGFGLGFGVVVDPVQAGVISSQGEYHWGGAAGTFFWIDPVEDLITVVMIQHQNLQAPLGNMAKAMIYAAITH